MRFKFPKFYNPYTRIADLTAWGQRVHDRNKRLKTVNASQRGEIVGLRTRMDNMAALWRNAFRDQAEGFDAAAKVLAKQLNGYSQAADAFMQEREELKGTVTFLTGALQEAMDTITTDRANREAVEQTLRTETLEVISYMKQCEAALLVAGVAIEDGEEGPKVIMDTAAVMEGLRAGSTKTAPPQGLAA